MITIGKVYKEIKEDGCYLCSRIQDESRHLDEVIWFRTTEGYGEFFYENCADPFLLLVALPAVKYHQNVMVEDSVSQSLYYHLNTAILHMFAYMYDDEYDGVHIGTRLIVKGSLIDITTSAQGVGCGCSLGVDSLSSIIRHLSDDCPSSYKLTHLTYFNLGALGRDAHSSKLLFDETLVRVSEFCDAIGLPLVTLESNSSLLYDPNVLCFEQTHTFRNAAAVLSLRKLFHKYYYASGYPIEDTKLSFESLSYQDDLLLPLLATDIEFIEADADKTRVAKTMALADNKLAQKYLHVCWHDMAPYYDPVWKMDLSEVKTINCSRCDKCLRTLSTLDVLGKIESFREVFDVDYYYGIRDDYFFKVLTTEDNPFYTQIANLIRSTHYPLSKDLQYKLKLHKYHVLEMQQYMQKQTSRVLRRIDRKSVV